ncbi:hypothetical protein E1293_16750 [Actinomadura darangshiensis]|uniref:Septum formation-related domain-containing protein n=1 Tax=Actinomadura darangshiensis TaxID=705336 RepID=A0A4R5BCK7_9ACTN|nr:DUF4190 domain-containing protein [Actinomadura darangshiensis]TDD82436.1 hypothetical protein E1293_16750 [Actinomadura darangshiensis]
MTTPPSADDDPEPGWAPPDAPVPASPESALPEPVPVTVEWAVPPPPPAVPERTNRLAIAALATGVIGLVVIGIGLGIAALVQAGRRGEKGRGLAVTGIAASVVWIIAGGVAAALAVGSMFSVDRDASGHISKGGKVLASTLRQGDCFTGRLHGRATLVTATPCTKPHDGEIIATSTLPDQPYSGDRDVREDAAILCDSRTLYLVKSTRYRYLRPAYLVPDEAAWESGNRQVACAVHYAGPGTLTTPVAATVDTNLKLYTELAAGDCLKDWANEGAALPIVECTKPHEFQVAAVFGLPLPGVDDPAYDGFPPYPGEKKARKLAIRGCDSRLSKVFKKHPPRVPVEESYIWPGEDQWNSGITTVICMVSGQGRKLKRSVVPH